ncbi:MAG: hypothetical protein ACNA8N_11030 [Trueperaceae bacterium]
MAASSQRFALLLALLALALTATGVAQFGPQVTLLAPDRPAPGDTVTLEATGLRDVDHVVRVEAPDGSETLTVTAAVGGRLAVEVTLEQVGRHVVWLEGVDIEAAFTVTATAPSGVPAPPDPVTPPATTPGESPAAEAVPVPSPDAETAPAIPTPTPDLAGIALDVDANVVTATGDDGRVRWRLPFAPASGVTSIALLHRESVWIAHGHQVIEADPATGRVRSRVATAGTVLELVPIGTGLGVTSEVDAPGSALTVEARLEAGRLYPPATFDPQGDLFDALLREAEVGDPAARLALDRTNPFLHLRAALVAPTEAERAFETTEAIFVASTFYDLARLARAFAAEGWWDAADAAMSAAAEDFAARGYDPALLTSAEVHERYGFPLQPLRTALMRGDLDEARLWATWLHALSGPDLPGAGAELRAFATALGRQGEREAAAAWRELAAERTNTAAGDAVARNALLLGRGGPVASTALMIAFFFLHLVLIVKYRRAQDLARRQRLESGQRPLPLPRLRAIRFYGVTEKLVLVIMLALAYATVVLVGWVQRGDPLVAAAAAGHLESPAAAAVWSSAAGDPASLAWVNAYRTDRAGHDELVRAALGSLEAPLLDPVFAALEAGDPVPTPSPVTLRAAAAGTWYGFVADAFVQPQLLLDDHLVLLGLPAWSWPAQLLLFWLVALWHLAWLLIPRPRYAAHAPRPLLYELLAILVPGSGQADELYGVLLLVPWALFGIDTVTQLLGGQSALGIPFDAGLVVLGVLYFVNLIAWAIEFASVRKRLAQLRADRPDLARAFGLKPTGAAAGQELDPA